MPNARVRANARTTPRPKPGSAESIRQKTAELKRSVDLLKAAKVVESELGLEEKAPMAANGQPPAAEPYPEIDEEVYHVLVWTSLAHDLVADLRIPKEMSDTDRMTLSKLDNVIERAHEAAQALKEKYHGEEATQ